MNNLSGVELIIRDTSNNKELLKSYHIGTIEAQNAATLFIVTKLNESIEISYEDGEHAGLLEETRDRITLANEATQFREACNICKMFGYMVYMRFVDIIPIDEE